MMRTKIIVLNIFIRPVSVEIDIALNSDMIATQEQHYYRAAIPQATSGNTIPDIHSKVLLFMPDAMCNMS
ncbi:hypothetical protein [Citrobacter sp. JGM124]|uniref:hypothetical protein n=1 Tax=Citrobacter sp. JGM124 TaxID=2799789 RepID=UPI001BAA3C68|nr:hypothetical protein [Citrobacter sp. JGM124]MBS0847903.1 hypothetical protein [Citrobacter sp. JGM124]